MLAPFCRCRQVLTRDAQLRIKAASEGAEGKPGRGRGRGRGRGSKARKDDTKQSKKTAPKGTPKAPKATASEPQEWDDWAEWDGSAEWNNDEEWDASAEWSEEWDGSAEWNDEEWAQWEAGTWKPKKRSREPKVAAGASRSKPVGRARPGDHASIHAVDETDTFSYPHTFARRNKPPIKGSDSEKLWMGIAKSFLQEIDHTLEKGTRTEAEAGITHEGMCCVNTIKMSLSFHVWAGLCRRSTGSMPDFAGLTAALTLEILASPSSWRWQPRSSWCFALLLPRFLWGIRYVT